jgi:G3E family GTPase
MQAGDGAALLANTCVCCSGLPGLEEAMADLYRARLERRIARFDAVVIETTGLAEPQPVREAFDNDPLLRERYALIGVITTVSATAPEALESRDEFEAQVRGADLLVITKTDRADAAQLDALRQRLQALNPHAAVAISANADLPAAQALQSLPAMAQAVSSPRSPAAPDPGHEHHHRHEAEVVFVPMPQPIGRAALAQRLQSCIAAGQPLLLRLKGVVIADDGSRVAVQWAPGDEEPVIAPFSGTPPEPGLAVIATNPTAARDTARRLEKRLASMPTPRE